MSSFQHTSILLPEVISFLQPWEGGVFVDGTLGGGGHALGVLQAAAAREVSITLIGVDRDPDALEAAGKRLADFASQVVLCRGNYGDLPTLLPELGFERVDGIFVDAGVSSHQLDTPERGFSFRFEGPLDMRMSQEGITAADLIDQLDVSELTRVLRDYGEIQRARSVARRIKSARESGALSTTRDLANLVDKPHRRPRSTHPATRIFQALRIAVNQELDALSSLVSKVDTLLNPKGRCIFLSFHSLEDRIVKRGLRSLAQGEKYPPDIPMEGYIRAPTMRLLTRKSIQPGEDEIRENPRARSARLRGAERLAP